MSNTVYVKNRKEWRKWLEKNHAKEKNIWLIYFKKHTGKPSVPYNDAVEEAICFGWIDSTVRRIDDERYMQLFTPRNAKSQWSELNIERAENMIRQQLMTEAGLEKFRKAEIIKSDFEQLKQLPEEITIANFEKLLKAHTQFSDAFYKMSPSHKRNYINWICEAKKTETKLARFNKMLTLLSVKQKSG